MQHKFFTTQNQPLSVLIYSLPSVANDPTSPPIAYTTLDGLPLGTSDNSQDGEAGVKVIVIGQRPATGVEGNGLVDSGPAENIVLVVPDDDNDLPHRSRGLQVNDAGDIKFTDAGGNETLVEDIVPGSILPYQVTRVWETGTTCTKIYNLY